MEEEIEHTFESQVNWALVQGILIPMLLYKILCKNMYIFFYIHFLGKRDYRHNQTPKRICDPKIIKNYYYSNYLIYLYLCFLLFIIGISPSVHLQSL